jgi:SOS response regulatory protein OraA/RecX
MAAGFAQAKEIAVNYIGISGSKSTGKIRQKLIMSGVDSAIIEDVMISLKELGYLDDEKIGRAVLRRHQGRRGKSRALLEALLINQGIERSVAAMLVASGPGDYELARLLAEALFPSGADRKIVYRRLLTRGFSPDLAAAVSADYPDL